MQYNNTFVRKLFELVNDCVVLPFPRFECTQLHEWHGVEILMAFDSGLVWTSFCKFSFELKVNFPNRMIRERKVFIWILIWFKMNSTKCSDKICFIWYFHLFMLNFEENWMSSDEYDVNNSPLLMFFLASCSVYGTKCQEWDANAKKVPRCRLLIVHQI